MMRHRLVRRLIGLEVADVVATATAALEKEKPGSTKALQSLTYNVCVHSPAFQERNRELKDFLYQNMYRHYRVVRMQAKAERFLEEIFVSFVERPAQLPPQTQSRVDVVGKHRAVCDYIAGMTDRYALEEHERLFGRFTRP
jgi:dGTPase